MGIIGIDLGTTNSLVSYIKDGKPVIIPNEFGELITPSVVGIDVDGEYYVGNFAKRQLVAKPDKTISEVKRLMGRDEKVKLGDREFLPEEISSILIKKLKKDAEDYIGKEVREAVITVPANFNDLQRQATKRAGELAGLVVERIINEPTAAALAYGLNKMGSEEKVLVYDLGGGTFDVTVFEIFEGIVDVKSSRGNAELGGKDFDELIVDYIVKDFYEKEDIDLREDLQAKARVKEAAEEAKIELSSVKATNILIPFIAINKDNKAVEVDIKLSRSKLEEMIKDLIMSTKVQINEALDAAGYKIDDLDVVLAVGGSTRIPMVGKLLKEIFNDKLKSGVNPDEAIVLGASIQAGIKSGKISSEDGLIIVNVANNSMGVEVTSIDEFGKYTYGVFDPLIKRDSKIPATKAKTYTTAADNQSTVRIRVHQGENPLADDNLLIEDFPVTDIPLAPAGVEKIEVSFAYNINEILEVTAKVVSTGKIEQRTIDIKKGKVSSVFEEEFIYSQWEQSQLSKEFKNTIELCEGKMDKLDDENRAEVQDLLLKLKKAITENNRDLAEKYDDRLIEILYTID